MVFPLALLSKVPAAQLAPPLPWSASAPLRAGRVHAVGAFSLLAYVLLAFLARSENLGVWLFWSVCGAAWIGLLLLLPFAGRVRPLVLLSWAVLFHLAGVFGGPFLEDDYHRYLWDGYRFAMDGTPYAAPPSAFFTDTSVPPALQGHLDAINNPNLPTIYGPLPEWLFRATYALAPGELWPLQLMLSAINLGVIILLTVSDVTPTARLLYAWNPLLIVETAFMAHPDILAAGLALTAWLALRGGRPAAAGALLAAACASRLVFVLAAPLRLARAGPRGWAAWLLVLAAIYAPFLANGATELSALFVFGQQWQFNAGLFTLLAGVVGDTAARIFVLVVTVILTLAMVSRLQRESSATALANALVLTLSLPLLLGPVVNAWYLIWLLPLAALSGFRFAPWIASAAVLLAYGTRFNLGWAPIEDYRQPGGLLVLEYGLIWVALGYEACRLWRKRNAIPTGKPSCAP